MDKQPAILKIFGSKYWNDDPFITGNREGLEKLKKVIEDALNHDEQLRCSQEVIETDGKPFHIYVKMYDGDLLDEKWLSLPTHYEDGDFLTDEERNLLDKFIDEYDEV